MKYRLSFDYPLFIIIFLKNLLPNSLYAVITVSYFSYLVFVKWNGKLIKTKLRSIKFYCFSIAVGIGIGIYFNDFRSIIRDLMYTVPTVLWIIIGALLFRSEDYTDGKFLSTVFLYGSSVGVYNLISFLSKFNFTFSTLKSSFSTGIYDIGYIFAISLILKMYNKKIFISKKIDYFLLSLMAMNIVFSVGRISILAPLIVIIFVLFFASIRKKVYMQRGITLLLLLTIVVLLILAFAPNRIIEEFTSKLMYTFDEINTSQLLNDYSAAMSNWRAYEMQTAIRQWHDSGLLSKIFGSGLGEGVKITFVPAAWMKFVVNGQIPVLHNGFYTILIKTGIIGLLALVLIYIETIISSVKACKKNMNDLIPTCMIGVMISSIAVTWVVRGPVEQSPFLAWGILVGWINERNCIR